MADEKNNAGPGGPPPGQGRSRLVLSDEGRRRAREAFMSVLDAASPAYEIGQLNLFHDEDEKFIRQEVERKLYDPQLPNGGGKERRVIERLKKLAANEDWSGYKRARAAIHSWETVLPADPRNAGRYYNRKPLTPKADKKTFEWLLDCKEAATIARQWDLKWFAELMLEGTPEPVSNFEMETLFLLRKSDGSVDRLVRLRNVLGEVSKGPHHKGSHLLDNKAFAAPERFREWCLGRGNFAWSGNQTDLHKLHEDNTHLGAGRVINQVDYCGWFPIDRNVQSPRSKVQSQLKAGIWFFDECAFVDGQMLRPDEDGIYWWQGEGYYLNRKGRESNFSQGRPKMCPEVRVEEIADGDEKSKVQGPRSKVEDRRARSDAPYQAELYREFYRAVSRNFYDTLGGYEGWLCLGAMFAYAAAPEIFAEWSLFPGLWIHGQMESGKTVMTQWLMHVWGFRITAGVGLRL